MTPLEQARQILANHVAAGATVEVLMPDGMRLGPSPVDWAKFDGREVGYWWIGDGERLHVHPVACWSVGDDHELQVATRNGYQVTLWWAWRPDWRQALEDWRRAREAGEPVAAREYPDGGHVYGR